MLAQQKDAQLQEAADNTAAEIEELQALFKLGSR